MRNTHARPRTLAGPAAICLSAFTLFQAGCVGLPKANSEPAQFYSKKCGGCHRVIRPGEYQSFQWERLLTMMERGLHHQQMKGGLSSDDKARLLPYLQEHAAPDQEQEKKLYDLDSKIM